MRRSHFVLLFAVFISLTVLLNSCDGAKKEKFRTSGIETTATINEVVWKKSGSYSGSDMKRKYNHFRVSYFSQINKPDSIQNQKIVEKDKNGDLKMNFDKLIPKIGEYVSTEIFVTSAQMKRYKKGDKIQILYLPDEIESAILKEDIE